MEPGGSEITLRVRAAGAFDGLVRLLSDAERSGFRLLHLDLVAPEGRETDFRLTLRLTPETDTSHVRRRFARHPSILSVEPA